jgi:DNA-binding winged helix-turn-helix (wHTH) protein
MTRSTVTFGPYRLDSKGPQLWRGEEPVALQRRPLAVLCYLAARPGEVVGRDELIRTLWAGTYVTRAVLKVAVHAVREALGDDADSPRYIETVGREGYRFIAQDTAAGTSHVPNPTMVGRAHELAVLRAAFDQAARGARRIVLVTGEGGIGKTTLIEHFLADVAHAPDTWVARGQCLEQYGGGEAYLPVLEAIGRLARDDGAGEVGRILRLHAPTWLHPPALDTDRAAGPRLPRGRHGCSRDGRCARGPHAREDPGARARDLQWSDPSTVDLIAYRAAA